MAEDLAPLMEKVQQTLQPLISKPQLKEKVGRRSARGGVGGGGGGRIARARDPPHAPAGAAKFKRAPIHGARRAFLSRVLRG